MGFPFSGAALSMRATSISSNESKPVWSLIRLLLGAQPGSKRPTRNWLMGLSSKNSSGCGQIAFFIEQFPPPVIPPLIKSYKSPLLTFSLLMWHSTHCEFLTQPLHFFPVRFHRLTYVKEINRYVGRQISYLYNIVSGLCLRPSVLQLRFSPRNPNDYDCNRYPIYAQCITERIMPLAESIWLN